MPDAITPATPAQPPQGPINKKLWGGIIIAILIVIIGASFFSAGSAARDTAHAVKDSVTKTQPTSPAAVNAWQQQTTSEAMQLATLKAQKKAIEDSLKANAPTQFTPWSSQQQPPPAPTQHPFGGSPAASSSSQSRDQIALDFTGELIKQSDSGKTEAAAPAAPAATAPPPEKKKEYDYDAATGRLYRLFEGDIIETVLTNRLNGAYSGPVNCMVTTDVYSHDHQQVLIPKGTRILGQVRAVKNDNQERLFVAFHRMVEPDGYSVSLDQFTGLNQVGETGLKDLVNHHYLQIFGTSLALAAIGAVAQVGNGYGGYSYDPAAEMRNGISQHMAESSQQVLSRFLNRLPTSIIREGDRVKIWLSDDLLLPAYANHTMDPNI